MPNAFMRDGVLVKTCTKCLETQPVSAATYGPSKKDGKDGLRGWCKGCVSAYGKAYYWANIEAQRERSRRKVATGAARAALRRHEMRRRYGLTPEQVDEMKAARDFRCDICGEQCKSLNPAKMLNVDHDHKTGAVRGMLCNNCNRGLGYFKDDLERFYSAIDYLKRTMPWRKAA